MGCALICAVALAGCAATPEPPQPEVVAINATSASARVERVDQKQRQLTLKLQDGRRIELAVSPEVRNFAQIRRGDTVEVRYVESVLLQVHPKGTAAPTASAGEYVQGAPAGEKPAGVAVITVPNDPLIDGLKAFVKKTPVGWVLGNRIQWGGDIYHLHKWTPDQFLKLL